MATNGQNFCNGRMEEYEKKVKLEYTIDTLTNGLVPYTQTISLIVIDFFNNQFFKEILDLWRYLKHFFGTISLIVID